MNKAKNREIEYADALPNSGVTAGRVDGPGMRFACGCEVTPYRISHCEFSRPAATPSGLVERAALAAAAFDDGELDGVARFIRNRYPLTAERLTELAAALRAPAPPTPPATQ